VIKFVDTYLDGLANLPVWAQSFLIGWAFSIGVTQSLKFLFPEFMPAPWREAASRWIAFLTAALPAGLWMLAADASPLACWLMAIGTGAWSPIAYALLIAFLRRFPKLSWIADVLSGDKRGVLAAKFKKDPPE
jgi:hypothetical protein